jgi:choline kinase
MYVVILAAGQGTRLRPLTDTVPKCLVEVAGRPLLDWQIGTARAVGLTNIAVVRGHGKDAVRRPGVLAFDNPHYATTNMVETLWCAESIFGDGFVVSYGDILYERSVLERLLADPHEISVVVDTGWRAYWERRFANVLDDAETLQADAAGRITSIGQKPERLEQIEGQYIGLMAFRGEGVAALRAVYRQAWREDAAGRNPLRGQRPVRKLYMTDVLQGLVDAGYPVHQVPVRRGWVEIDSLRDLELAQAAVRPGRDTVTITG